MICVELWQLRWVALYWRLRQRKKSRLCSSEAVWQTNQSFSTKPSLCEMCRQLDQTLHALHRTRESASTVPQLRNDGKETLCLSCCNCSFSCQIRFAQSKIITIFTWQTLSSSVTVFHVYVNITRRAEEAGWKRFCMFRNQRWNIKV